MPSAALRRRSWARVPLALALAFATLLAPGLTTAAHAATAQVGVLVVDRAGSMNILGNATIEVFTSDPAPGNVEPIHTATNGWWSLVDFEEGTYWIRARVPGYIEQTVRRTFSAGRQAIEIVLSMDPNWIGQVTGLVQDPSGAPFAAGRGRVEIVDTFGRPVTAAYTDQSGMYSATMRAGSYKVRVTDTTGRLAGTWINGTSLTDATPVEVPAHVSTRLPDVTLQVGQVLSGRITDSTGGPVADGQVQLFRAEDRFTVIQSASASRRGAYELENIEPGPYKVQFTDPQGEFLARWHGGDTFEDAETVQITADMILDAQLATAPVSDEPFAVTGLVQDAAGAPVRGVAVSAVRHVVSEDSSSWDTVARVLTTSKGRYTFPGLEPGDYRLLLAPSDDRGDFEQQWYGGSSRPSTARSIEVTEAGGVEADTATIVHHGSISGTVSVPADLADSDVRRSVEVFDEDGMLVGDAAVSDDGDYALTHLRPGRHTVRVSGSVQTEEGPTALVPQFWRRAYSFATATLVRVTPEGDAAGIDLALGDTIAHVIRPTVSGTGAYGTTLTASPGTWNRQAGTAFSYQWTRNGAPIAGATKTTYPTTAADLGRKVAVTVTATDRYDALGSGSATSAARTVTGKATVGAKASGARKSATVTVSLALQGVAKAGTTGIVRIYDGKKLKKTVTVRKGTAAVKVTGLKKGKHTLTVKFAGSGSHTAAAKSTTVKVR